MRTPCQRPWHLPLHPARLPKNTSTNWLAKATVQEGTAMLRGDLGDPEECRLIASILARIGDKWSVLIVGALGDGLKRFSDLRRLLGSISQRMLTLTLRGLERDGLVSRTVTPSNPPRVDYELTTLGRTLLAPVESLTRWVRTNRLDIEAARAKHEGRASRTQGNSRRT
jgi:DNA-binding HxlR family transcriptional regulator